MREATHVVNRKPAIIINAERANCQPGTLNGKRTIMATGAVNGITDSQKASELSGLLTSTENDKM